MQQLVMPPPLLDRLTPATAYHLGAFKARYEMADDDCRQVFHHAALALAWERFIGDFAPSSNDLFRSTLSLTQSRAERGFFLATCAKANDLGVRSAVRPLANIWRSPCTIEGMSSPNRLLTIAWSVRSSLSVADPFKLIALLVDELKKRPDFCEGRSEYAVVNDGDRVIGYHRSGQRAAAWAASMIVAEELSGACGLTPLPCYGLVTRQMLRPDVSAQSLEGLIDRAMASIVADYATRLASIVTTLRDVRERHDFHRDGQAQSIVRYLAAFGALRSAHLPTLTGRTRSSLSRALVRLTSDGFCRFDRSTGIVELLSATRPRRFNSVASSPTLASIAEVDASMDAVDRLNARYIR